jgi:hypothetical protein
MPKLNKETGFQTLANTTFSKKDQLISKTVQVSD